MVMMKEETKAGEQRGRVGPRNIMASRLVTRWHHLTRASLRCGLSLFSEKKASRMNFV